MKLIHKIIECNDNELDSIINTHIYEANKNADKIEKLGFLDSGQKTNIFKGFIPLNARIKYENLNMADYGMQSTDFIYEFVHFIKKYKISNKGSLILCLETFINNYFGYPSNIDREFIFNDIAWKTTSTDEEYFKRLRDNKIGDLKGTGAAQCTEKSALVQQILSLFDFEVYYCIGSIKLNEKQECHCFNIVKRQNDYALVDYSIPVGKYNENGSVETYYPFIGILTNEEFLDFINNGMLKSFDDYCIINQKNKKNGMKRMYVAGRYEIDKENQKQI